jgi:hypothetical protein
MLPDRHDQRYTPAITAACQRIEGVLRHAALFKDTIVTARLADGRSLGLQIVPQSAMGDDRSQHPANRSVDIVI